MIIYAGKDYQDVSRKAANIMSAQIIMKPDAVLGLATGSTPVGMYAQLVEWYKKGDLDFSRVTSDFPATMTRATAILWIIISLTM